MECNQVVWYYNNSSSIWEKASIVEKSTGQVTLSSGTTLSEQDVLHANPVDSDKIDDINSLMYLHTPALVHVLKSRYKSSLIYTKSGVTLVAVNPLKSIPKLYGPAIMKQYLSSEEQEEAPILPPHAYTIAAAAFHAIQRPEHRNQSIVVSGNSGSGKTFTIKLVLEFLSVATTGSSTSVSTKRKSINKLLLATTPILEAFGNAATCANDNSSRFGKYMSLDFHNTSVTGARINTYLLEKVRVTAATSSSTDTLKENERNFHIFYQMLASNANDLNNNDESFFRYLGRNYRKMKSDQSDFLALNAAFKTLDIPTDEIFKTVACVLHLGNLEFQKSSEDDKCEIQDSDAKNVVMSYFNHQNFETALCYRKISVGKDDSAIMIPLSPSEASATRDSLAKALYHTLFEVIVAIINEKISDHSTSSSSSLTSTIGLLDIFGFEDHVNNNSFSQLCINFANESLQQHFNNSVIFSEQALFIKEGITSANDAALSSSSSTEQVVSCCLDLLNKPSGGVFQALDDQSRLGARGSDEAFAATMDRKRHKCLLKTNTRSVFSIKHYAGVVTYDVAGMVEKNQDRVASCVLELVNSKIPDLLATRSMSTDLKLANHKSSCSAHFRKNLKELLDTLSDTETRYIRCIKPNDGSSNNNSKEFVSQEVLTQLTAGGVVEAIRVAREGLPYRISHEECFYKFRPVFPTSNNIKAMVQEMKKAANDVKFGRSLVFFSTLAIHKLETRLVSVITPHVITLQRTLRGYVARSAYQKLLRATRVLQRAVRKLTEKSHSTATTLRTSSEFDDVDVLGEETEEEFRGTVYFRPGDDDDDFMLQSRPTFRMSVAFDFKETSSNAVTTRSSVRHLVKDDGDTLLHVASSCCAVSDVAALLKSCDVNAQNAVGKTPLHVASYCNHVSVVKCLLSERHVLTNLATFKEQQTPLHLTTSVEIIDLILRHPSFSPEVINAIDREGKTALWHAAARGDAAIVKRLILEDSLLIDLAEDTHHQSALHIAIRKGHFEVATMLLNSSEKHDLDMNLCDSNLNTALHFAASRDRSCMVSLVKSLIAAGADVNAINSRGQSPLAVHLLSTRNHTNPTVTRILLTHGALPTLFLKEGPSLLQIAIERSLFPMACSLVASGASFNIPLHTAEERRSRNPLLIEVLSKQKLKLLLSSIAFPPVWVSDSAKKSCMSCHVEFRKVGRRARHHCRNCGRLCCGVCTSYRVLLSDLPLAFSFEKKKGLKNAVRTCQSCYDVIQLKKLHALRGGEGGDDGGISRMTYRESSTNKTSHSMMMGGYNRASSTA